jgi:Kef-type K+ transport system membrane component KefB
LALALIALRIGVIDTTIYTGLIIMTLATTTAFPFIISRMIKKDKNIMD